MFVIKTRDGQYFHNKGRIILYETQNQAQRYIEEFIQYALARVAQEDPMKAMSVPITVMQNSVITPVDFDIDSVECGTIYVTDI